MYEDKLAEEIQKRLAYARSIEKSDPELAQLIREKAMKELQEDTEAKLQKGGVTKVGVIS